MGKRSEGVRDESFFAWREFVNAEGARDIRRGFAVFFVCLEVSCGFNGGLPLGEISLHEVMGFQSLEKSNEGRLVVAEGEAKGFGRVAVFGGAGLFDDLPGGFGIEGG